MRELRSHVRVEVLQSQPVRVDPVEVVVERVDEHPERVVAVKIGVPHEVSAANVAATVDAAERAIREAEPVAQVIYIEPDIYVEGHVTDARPAPPEPAGH